MNREWPFLPLRIGTRGSPLALAQARELRRRLTDRHSLGEDAFKIVPIKTTGDAVRDRPLHEIGGKGLFVAEIDRALLSGDIDVAVHSLKDRPSGRTEGLRTVCVLPREDVRDAFVSLGHPSLIALPEGARVGTSSPRRRSQILGRRPDVRIVDFRGNVGTRLEKLRNGEADATILAAAGLSRLGQTRLAACLLDPDDALPAVAQGAIGVDARRDSVAVARFLAAVSDRETELRVTAERAFLERIDGSCRTAVAGLAEVQGGGMRLRGEILSDDGSVCIRGCVEGSSENAVSLGQSLADELRRRPGAQACLPRGGES